MGSSYGKCLHAVRMVPTQAWIDAAGHRTMRTRMSRSLSQCAIVTMVGTTIHSHGSADSSPSLSFQYLFRQSAGDS
jgi:hypothetical protein